MGYNTVFHGKFTLDRPLDDDTYQFLRKLADTRRMKRKVDDKYGVDGEFYVDGAGYHGQDREANIVDYNTPPKTQPSLWCSWEPTPDRMSIQWNGSEKFYSYADWMVYIVSKILKPRGYVLNGAVAYTGEDKSDTGFVIVQNNETMMVTTRERQ